MHETGYDGERKRACSESHDMSTVKKLDHVSLPMGFLTWAVACLLTMNTISLSIMSIMMTLGI